MITGVGNLHFRGVLTPGVLGSADFWSGPWGRALLWKLIAVGGMILASALHDFVIGPAAVRVGPGDRPSRRRAAWLARANAILGVVAVLAAVRLARGG